MKFEKKHCVAMLLAGGQGSRLKVLTENTAKPAVPFGGKYRIIDFPLSNCVNSGINTVGILTQYQPLELNEYIGNGQPWGLNRSHGGVQVLPPYAKSKKSEWYKGTANAICQNIPFIDRYRPENVLILSGDHIYKMDYSAMLRSHESSGADCTIAVRDVPLAEASRFGIMNTNADGTIYEFEEKPAHPKSTNASMGIYIFRCASTCWRTTRIPNPRTTSARTSSPSCWIRATSSSPTPSTATGRTWAPSPRFGRPTWSCWVRSRPSICTRAAGSTPGTTPCPPASSPATRSPRIP